MQKSIKTHLKIKDVGLTKRDTIKLHDIYTTHCM